MEERTARAFIVAQAAAKPAAEAEKLELFITRVWRQGDQGQADAEQAKGAGQAAGREPGCVGGE